MEIDELLNSAVSSELLSELLPEKDAGQWLYWLSNNRNPARPVSVRIPFEKFAGGVFYRREELVKFAEFERSRKLGTIKLTGRAAEVVQAFGIGTAHGSATGKRLDNPTVTLQIDQGTRKRYVQLITANPLSVYRIELDTALALGKDLVEVAKAGIRQSASVTTDADNSKYETVTKNATWTIERLDK